MEQEKKCIVFSGGGTAGHVFPCLALIERLLPACRIVYIGSINGMEKELVSKSGVKYYGITTVKLKRKVSPSNLLIPFRLHKGIAEAKKILREEKPALVFTKGGFVSLPVALAAAKLGIPLFSHESDFSVGLANRLTRKKCTKFFTAFPETAEGLSNGQYVGAPVRPSVLDGRLVGDEGKIFARIKSRAASQSKKVLLIMGGSLGAGAINAAAAKNIDSLCQSFEVVHLTGRGKKTDIVNEHYTQMEFCANMGGLYSITDVALSRGGGSALFELAALKIPSLIVPLPKGISRGDQIDNAASFSVRGLCHVLQEDEFVNADLRTKLLSALSDTAIKNALSNANVDGTDKILSALKEYL